MASYREFEGWAGHLYLLNLNFVVLLWGVPRVPACVGVWRVSQGGGTATTKSIHKTISVTMHNMTSPIRLRLDTCARSGVMISHRIVRKNRITAEIVDTALIKLITALAAWVGSAPDLSNSACGSNLLMTLNMVRTLAMGLLTQHMARPSVAGPHNNASAYLLLYEVPDPILLWQGL